MRKCANISSYMRRSFVIYDLCNFSILNFLLYGENFIFFFISVEGGGGGITQYWIGFPLKPQNDPDKKGKFEDSYKWYKISAGNLDKS